MMRERSPLPALLWFLLFFLMISSAVHAAGALDEIRRRGELVIATDATYPPFEYKENGTLQGFDIDLGNQIAREIGVKARWVPMEWSGVFAAVATGKADLVMSGVTITEERKKGNAFSRPYFLSGQVIARRKGDTQIDGPDALAQNNRVIAVQQETTGQFAMEKRGVPGSRIHRFDTLQDALLDVRNRNSAAAVGDLPALAAMIRKGYSELELVSPVPFVAENVGIVARVGENDLVARLNQAIETIIADGRYAQIYEKWIKEAPPGDLIARLNTVKDDGTLSGNLIAAASGNSPNAAPTASAPSAFAIRPDLLGRALPLLLQGAKLTVLLTVISLLIGVPFGLLLALGRLSGNPLLRGIAGFYVEVVRGTPLLMQIYVVYFVLPAIGIQLPALAAGIAALSFNSAAYCAEIFRAGILSIDRGQSEAAGALALNNAQTMRYVILPQTLRRVLPPLTNESIALLKDSSLVSVVALSELMRVGKEIATNTGSPTTIYLAVALLYLVLTLPLTLLARHLEARLAPGGGRRRNTSA